MALVSVIKQLSYKSKIDIKNTGLLGIGSVIGGLLGQKLLTFILKIVQGRIVSLVQSGILALLLIFVYIYMNNKEKFKVTKLITLF
ncbi:TPA: hypothetical protein ACG0NJ_002031 [Clostridium perfringens]|uniref:Membrane transporter protein n=1 Tax=Clostridium perfringens TaxID=1502 RepID=A0A2X3CFJ1_CLOPF|nr:hypothetical protein [Clostridium perfringens]MDG6877491.1 hypothetical protein [Clostridium perfringens]MDG6884444.1 hypothetical protein [Clostridium perfringens]MDG6887149.1 hypothetical protein [Clostridium perfringens]MDH5078564.1 hypothetical protein [Clostridium perfringens]MDK0889999.1 hypothetical protein [Clostridium perfringens]